MKIAIESNLFLIQSYHEKEINLFVFVPNILAKTNEVLDYRTRKQFNTNMYGGHFSKNKKNWEIKFKNELLKELRNFIIDEQQTDRIANLIESTIAANIDAILAQIELKNKVNCVVESAPLRTEKEYEFGTFFYEPQL